MLVTLEVRSPLIGWSKIEFDRHIQDMLVTLEMCPLPIDWLKIESYRNIRGMLVQSRRARRRVAD